MSISLCKQEVELWAIGCRDGSVGDEKTELSEASIIYRDGWRHGVLRRITRELNKEKTQ
jgi:hypothetical protein